MIIKILTFASITIDSLQAMLEDYRRYPMGIQNLEQLRTLECVYADKIELVYRLIYVAEA